MSALEALLMEIPEIADEMDIANRLIELREPAAAEMAELKARLEKLEREQSEEVDEFNAGYEAFKAGKELNSAESEYSHSVAKSYDVFKVGFLYASALEAELKGNK